MARLDASLDIYLLTHKKAKLVGNQMMKKIFFFEFVAEKYLLATQTLYNAQSSHVMYKILIVFHIHMLKNYYLAELHSDWIKNL